MLLVALKIYGRAKVVRCFCHHAVKNEENIHSGSHAHLVLPCHRSPIGIVGHILSCEFPFYTKNDNVRERIDKHYTISKTTRMTTRRTDCSAPYMNDC